MLCLRTTQNYLPFLQFRTLIQVSLCRIKVPVNRASRGSGDKLLPCFHYLLEASCIPWLVAPFSIFKASNGCWVLVTWYHSDSFSVSLFYFEGPLGLHWAHWDNPEESPYSKVSWLATCWGFHALPQFALLGRKRFMCWPDINAPGTPVALEQVLHLVGGWQVCPRKPQSFPFLVSSYPHLWTSDCRLSKASGYWRDENLTYIKHLAWCPTQVAISQVFPPSSPSGKVCFLLAGPALSSIVSSDPY